MNNYLERTFILTLTVVAGLLALHFLPNISLFGHSLRTVDILSEIFPPIDEEEDNATPTLSLLAAQDSISTDSAKAAMPENTDTASAPLPLIQPQASTYPKGYTKIEDYSVEGDARGMQHFYNALKQTSRRPVRIAYFGDSFVEGDILTGDLREMLQDRFGGCGAGWIDIHSEVAGFRQTVRATSKGFSAFSAVQKRGFKASQQGIAQRYFIPTANSFVRLQGTKHGKHLATAETSSLYFTCADRISLTAVVNDSIRKTFTFNGGTQLQQATVSGNIASVQWKLPSEAKKSGTFYAATFDGTSGIVLDNFSLRGSNGHSLISIPEERMKQFAQFRPYDLIVLHYGLNVAGERTKDQNLKIYTDQMERVINYFKRIYPQASILVVSVSDRDQKTKSGNLRTYPAVKSLVRYQQQLAARTHTSFWNLYEAMGGENSMSTLVNNKPPMANRDYTHLNFSGGRHLAELFYKALMGSGEKPTNP